MTNASNSPLSWVELELFCYLRHRRFVVCCIVKCKIADLVLDTKRLDDLQDLGSNVLAGVPLYQLRSAKHDFMKLVACL